jgi:hypothetical protein
MGKSIFLTGRLLFSSQRTNRLWWKAVEQPGNGHHRHAAQCNRKYEVGEQLTFMYYAN